MHHRLEPQKHRFQYKLFMFSLDLDEIDSVSKIILLVSRNRFNVFNFRERDYALLPTEQSSEFQTVKERIIHFATMHGIGAHEINRVQLVANLRTLGYQFNPVSFYFCFDKHEKPLCSVVEVCNTFRERKLYFLGSEAITKTGFSTTQAKNFYVSPFIDLDIDFEFDLCIPDDRLKIKINDYQKGRKFFLSTLTGERKAITNWNAFLYAIRFPLVTFQVITLIYWQAFKLWIKGISYHKKSSFKELQQEVLNPHKSLLN